MGEVADRAGLDEDTLRRRRRACGLPDPGGERACPAVEVELWQAAAPAIALVGDESLSGFLWSLGAAASASAEATLALARAANPLSWQSEAEYAEWALGGAQLIAQIPRALDLLFRLHVPLAGDRILRYAEAPEEFTEFTVGFVDLVDSTSVVERTRPGRRQARPAARRATDEPRPSGHHPHRRRPLEDRPANGGDDHVPCPIRAVRRSSQATSSERSA